METQFTPVHAVAGGALIGLAVVVLFLGLGRIAGVSGMFTVALRPSTAAGERAWRIAFLLGLILGPVGASAALGETLVRPSPAGLPMLIVAGLAVGLGTGMANGCTSGHGVCGIARLSKRSLVATGVFMALGVLTASVLRHLVPG